MCMKKPWWILIRKLLCHSDISYRELAFLSVRINFNPPNSQIMQHSLWERDIAEELTWHHLSIEPTLYLNGRPTAPFIKFCVPTKAMLILVSSWLWWFYLILADRHQGLNLPNRHTLGPVPDTPTELKFDCDAVMDGSPTTLMAVGSNLLLLIALHILWWNFGVRRT